MTTIAIISIILLNTSPDTSKTTINNKAFQIAPAIAVGTPLNCMDYYSDNDFIKYHKSAIKSTANIFTKIISIGFRYKAFTHFIDFSKTKNSWSGGPQSEVSTISCTHIGIQNSYDFLNKSTRILKPIVLINFLYSDKTYTYSSWNSSGGAPNYSQVNYVDKSQTISLQAGAGAQIKLKRFYLHLVFSPPMLTYIDGNYSYHLKGQHYTDIWDNIEILDYNGIVTPKKYYLTPCYLNLKIAYFF